MLLPQNQPVTIPLWKFKENTSEQNPCSEQKGKAQRNPPAAPSQPDVDLAPLTTIQPRPTVEHGDDNADEDLDPFTPEDDALIILLRASTVYYGRRWGNSSLAASIQ